MDINILKEKFKKIITKIKKIDNDNRSYCNICYYIYDYKFR